MRIRGMQKPLLFDTIQFMYGGKLQRVKSRYTGHDIDAVLDRLPIAKFSDEDEEGYAVSAEVFGKRDEMWFLSKGVEGGKD